MKKSNLFRYIAGVFLLFMVSMITSHLNAPTMSIVTYPTTKTLESQPWSSRMGKIVGMGRWTERGQPVGWLEALERETTGEDKGKPKDTGEEGMVLSR
jgi:hypothetical protein